MKTTYIRMFSPFFTIIPIILTSISCLSSLEPEVSLHLPPEKDSEYYQKFTSETHNYEVIRDFETHYTLHVTNLSNELLKALSKRHQNLFHEPGQMFNDIKDKTGFFITLYTADKELNDLTNKHLWTVILDSNGKTKRPESIKRLKKKERWSPFFSTITPWSKEYLLIFNTPSDKKFKKEPLESSNRKLIFSNSNGKVTIKL